MPSSLPAGVARHLGPRGGGHHGAAAQYTGDGRRPGGRVVEGVREIAAHAAQKIARFFGAGRRCDGMPFLVEELKGLRRGKGARELD